MRKITVMLNEKENIPYFVDVINLNTVKNNDLKGQIKYFGKNLFLSEN